MRIQDDRQTVTYQDWTIRVRPAERLQARLLLLIHGWTGDENSMWVFTRDLSNAYWIIAPQGPYIANPGGYSWRLPQTKTHGRSTIDDFRQPIEALVDLITSYSKENNIRSVKFDVIGFSQGAAVASTLALMHPERIGRVGLLAGFFPAGLESLISKGLLSGIPFFLAHGTLDELVKIEYARQSVRLLEEANAQVTYCEDKIGHKVSQSCLRALVDFFA